jgi:NADH-quinone oxidoreductase subunit L
VVTLPLVLLAIPSLLIGYFALEPMLVGDFFKNVITVDAAKHPALAEFVKAHVEHGPVAMALHGFVTPVFWLAAAGVALAWYFYLVKPAIPAWFMAKFGVVYRLLDNKYYMDKINEVVFAGGSRALGTGLWQGGDVRVIDGAVVNGSARLIGWLASVVRYLQSGLLSQYAFAMILGIVLLLAYFTVPR